MNSTSAATIKTTSTTWAQWDKQEARRIQKAIRAEELHQQDQAFFQLNNLYLKVEAGEVRMSVKVSNQLRTLATEAYDRGDPMLEYWAEEFIKLPRWNDF